MFAMKVTFQKILLIKVEEELEILVGSSMRGDGKFDENVSTKIIDKFRCFILQQIYVKITKKNFFIFEFSLLSFPNNGSVISFVKLFTCRDGCLQIHPAMMLDDLGHTISIKIDSNLPGM